MDVLVSERYIHKKFIHEKIRGEWFRPANSIIEYIKKLKSKRGSIDSIFSKTIPPMPKIKNIAAKLNTLL